MREIPLIGGPVQIVGVVEVEQTPRGLALYRLPAAARAQIPDDFLRGCVRAPGGGHLRLRTDATRLELDLRVERTVVEGREGAPGAGGLADLVVDGDLVAQAPVPEAGTVLLEPQARTARVAAPAPVSTLGFDLPGSGLRDVELWLPYAEAVELVALRVDGQVLPPSDHHRPRWVHHGSSISHGADATSPTRTWTALAAAATGTDLLNLGFSGNAVLDPFVARTIAALPAEVISLKLGINLVNGDLMRLRAFVPAVEGFLDTIREGHPQTPLIVASPLLCPMVEDRPGPTDIDPASPLDAPTFFTSGAPEEVAQGKLSLQVIRAALAAIVTRRRDAGDEALVYVDGLTLFGEDDWQAAPMPDLLHPDDAGMRIVADRFAPHLRRALAGAARGARAGSDL